MRHIGTSRTRPVIACAVARKLSLLVLAGLLMTSLLVACSQDPTVPDESGSTGTPPAESEVSASQNENAETVEKPEATMQTTTGSLPDDEIKTENPDFDFNELQRKLDAGEELTSIEQEEYAKVAHPSDIDEDANYREAENAIPQISSEQAAAAVEAFVRGIMQNGQPDLSCIDAERVVNEERNLALFAVQGRKIAPQTLMEFDSIAEVQPKKAANGSFACFLVTVNCRYIDTGNLAQTEYTVKFSENGIVSIVSELL